MRWSLRIVRVAGIGVYVHITFLLLPLWVGFSSFSERGLWSDAAVGVAFILVLFGIVVLHELAHALTARRFGIRTRDITLLPIGGVARLERIPENPRQELLVALAGPAVNVGIALLLFGIIAGAGPLGEAADLAILGGGFLASLMWINVGLAVFNLIPAFPMDGGRVLRALLAMRLNYVRATRLAAGLGQTIAFLFGFVGLSSLFLGHLGPFSNPFLLLVALFVWMGARQESGLVQMKATLGAVPVGAVMIKEFRCLSAHEPLMNAAEKMLAVWQHDFPVVENGKPVGLLTRSALVDGLAQRGGDALVEDVMSRDMSFIELDANAEAALTQLRSGEAGGSLLVVHEGALLGIVTREHVAEYLLLRAAVPSGDLPGVFPVNTDHRRAA